MYTTKEELSELVRQSQKAGGLTPELVGAVFKIASGWWRKRKVYGHGLELEDYRQECALGLVKKLRKLNPEQNLFSYLTNHCRMLLQHLLRQQRAQERRLAKYRNKVADAFRWEMRLQQDLRHEKQRPLIEGRFGQRASYAWE